MHHVHQLHDAAGWPPVVNVTGNPASIKGIWKQVLPLSIDTYGGNKQSQATTCQRMQPNPPAKATKRGSAPQEFL